MENIYWVKYDGEDNRATGHISVCKCCRGVEKATREKDHNRCWLGPFGEKRLAEQAGNATGRRFAWCYYCRNFTGELPSWLPPSRASEHLHRQVSRMPPDRYQGDQTAGRGGNSGTKSG
jgi:hypothetical protein